MLGAPATRSSRLLPGPLVLGRAAHRLVHPGSFLVRCGRLGFLVCFGRNWRMFLLLVPASSGVLRFPLFRGWFAPVAIGKNGLQWSGLTPRSTGLAPAFLRRLHFILARLRLSVASRLTQTLAPSKIPFCPPQSLCASESVFAQIQVRSCSVLGRPSCGGRRANR